MGPLSLPDQGTVYADAQVFIYAVEKRPPYCDWLRPLWEQADAGQLRIATSELSLLEVLVRPLRDGDAELVHAYREVLDSARLALLPITADVLLRAAELRATYASLRTPDAIHCATALSVGAALLVSNDLALRQISGLPLLLLDDLAPEA